MRFEDMLNAEMRACDGNAMSRAIVRLRELGIDARRPSGKPHQIKVAPNLSYYPTSGKIVRDATPASKARGLDALLKLLGK